VSRVVLTTWGSLGDLHPMLALGLELRSRGHDVIFATPEYYQNKIEQLGFAFHTIRPNLPEDPATISRIIDLKKGTEVVLKEVILSAIRDTYQDLLAVAQDADFMVAHEIIFAAPIVAEVLNMRWASCTLVPAAFFSAYDPSVIAAYPGLAKLRRLGPSVNRLVINLADIATRSWGKPLYELRKQLELPPMRNSILGHSKYSPYLVLALFSSVFGKPQPDWPSNSITTGFTFYDGEQERILSSELETFLEAGEPPIVFTLGSAVVGAPGDFYGQSVQAATGLGRRAVLLIGKNAPPEELPQNMFACEYAPYSQLFPRACAVVHQGGIGTTAQALRAGCPTLVVPHLVDQPDNAARLERLGTSRTLARRDYLAPRVEKELAQLLDEPSYQQKANEVGLVIGAESGTKSACDVIEQQLEKALLARPG